MLLVPQSPGEVCDRVAILDLKCHRLADASARGRALRLRAALQAAWREAGLPDDLPEAAELARVNAELWDVEDAVRVHERDRRFDGAFVELARSVYRLNDHRAALKAAIDRRLGSELSEPKSYGDER